MGLAKTAAAGFIEPPRFNSKIETPVGERKATKAFQLEIAGGVAQEPEKLVSGDQELKRTRMKFLWHHRWIT
jgi:hypothetical protein